MVAASTLYGGTYTQFDVSFRRLGIRRHVRGTGRSRKFPQSHHAEDALHLWRDDQRIPRMNVLDIEAVAKIAHENRHSAGDRQHLRLALRSAGPSNTARILWSIPLTKFMGGHGNSIGGMIVDGGKFDWNNGKFPDLSGAQSRAYHGMKFSEVFGNSRSSSARASKACAISAPASAPSIRSCSCRASKLCVRMERHCRNAQAVASSWKSTRQ